MTLCRSIEQKANDGPQRIMSHQRVQEAVAAVAAAPTPPALKARQKE